MTATAEGALVATLPPRPRAVTVGGVAVAGTLAALAIAAVHLTQGTSAVAAGDLLGLLVGDDAGARDVLLGSRLPRLVAGAVVGVALGVAGAALQSVARNPLASPELLGVSAGAHLAVTAVAAFGLSLPVWSAGGVAFLGGLLAATLVMAVSAAGAAGPTRLVLAGSATALALHAATNLLLILFEEETKGLYGWGSGSLLAVDTSASEQMAPALVLAVAGLVMLGRRLDVVGLGDDAATALGVRVASTRALATVLAVVLAAAAVTVAGPVGFVGLCAPASVRLLGRWVPGILRHRVLLPLSGIFGVIVVLGADVLLRAFLGSDRGVEIPTGVVTSLFGAVVLVALARHHGRNGPAAAPPAVGISPARSAVRFRAVLAIAVVAAGGVLVAGLLLGGRTLLLGDVATWLEGAAPPRIAFVLDERAPRIVAALLAGGALAIAGTAVQAVSRNPLAEPGVLGITAGAGFGAVLAATIAPGASIWLMVAAATAAAVATFAVTYRVAWRGGVEPDRLVLVGIGMAAGLAALTVVVIMLTDPWNTPKALTWLSGSTYGRRPEHLWPVALVLAATGPLLLARHRALDLVAVDDDTPRVLGVRLEGTRLVALASAVALSAAATAAAGVLGFVGLLAPHAARALVGGQHRRLLPVAALLGAVLVGAADTLGRTVIAPAQVPAGLVTALLGTPYFVWLLWRARTV